MEDSKETRAAKTKDITDKEEEAAKLKLQLSELKNDKEDTTEELMAIVDKIQGLHQSCDFIVKNYDLRKKARGEEIDNLQNAIAVLSGAKLSLLAQRRA